MLIILALAWGVARIFYLRRNGVSVLAVLGRRRSLVEWGSLFVAIIVDGYLILRSVWPEVDSLVWATMHRLSPWGVLIMAMGIALAIVSQIAMGHSWRIGVPTERAPDQALVTDGLHAFSRNPIYVGVMLFLIGSLILAPGPLTIGGTLATWWLLRAIIREEEAFLEREFGDAYRVYCARVRRWL